MKFPSRSEERLYRNPPAVRRSFVYLGVRHASATPAGGQSLFLRTLVQRIRIMKQTENEKALTLVEKKLPTLKGQVTPQDAASFTGVSLDEANDALSRLMELYVTRVTYDEQGNLLFAFEMPLRRRGTKTAAEKWAEVKGTLWRGFKIFFKIWIGVMVIAYFVIMVIILIALLLARQSSQRDNDRDNDRGNDMIGGLFRVMAEGLRFAFWTRALSPYGYTYAVDDHGYRHREVSTPRDADGKEKSFIVAIYDLALGPERPPSDPLENEREVATFLRAEKGIITPAEIVALSGGTVAEAEERMADYLVRYKGEPEITEEGVVVGEFPGLLSGSTEATSGTVVPFWNEFEAPYEHSGNSSSRNAAILGMVGFTAVMGLVLLGGGLDRLALYGPFFRTGFSHFLLGWVPVLFSIVYMLVAALRIPGVRKLEAERLERNRKKMVLRALYQGRLWRSTADQVHFHMLSLGEKTLDRDTVEATLQGLVKDLGGDVDLSDDGTPVYRFERLEREFEASERLRGRRASF